MAKKNRIKLTSESAKEALEITNDLVKDTAVKKTSKKEAKRLNLRIPKPLADRLEVIVEKTGLSQTAIVLGGLNAELSRLEKN